MFENPEVSPSSLASPEDLEWRPLHSSFARRRQAGAFLYVVPWVAGGAALLVHAPPGAPEPGFAALVWALASLLIARALFWPLIEVPRRGYVLRERDIAYRRGVIWRSVATVPFNRVQHTRIRSGPLDRLFGIATLSLYPAGAGGQEVEGLEARQAEELRAYITARIEAEPSPLHQESREVALGEDEHAVHATASGSEVAADGASIAATAADTVATGATKSAGAAAGGPRADEVR